MLAHSTSKGLLPASFPLKFGDRSIILPPFATPSRHPSSGFLHHLLTHPDSPHHSRSFQGCQPNHGTPVLKTLAPHLTLSKIFIPAVTSGCQPPPLVDCLLVLNHTQRSPLWESLQWLFPLFGHPFLWIPWLTPPSLPPHPLRSLLTRHPAERTAMPLSLPLSVASLHLQMPVLSAYLPTSLSVSSDLNAISLGAGSVMCPIHCYIPGA